jgi:hypothetical protein
MHGASPNFSRNQRAGWQMVVSPDLVRRLLARKEAPCSARADQLQGQPVTKKWGSTWQSDVPMDGKTETETTAMQSVDNDKMKGNLCQS